MLVKSKSMTTEEIHFNERLEEHQLEAVETDLGEYILQLAHQRPYHIVAPALHMTRYDVADLFTKELGVENEVVIEKQTKIARAASCARNSCRRTSASAARISWWPIRAPSCWSRTKATPASPPRRRRFTSPSPASKR